MTADVCDVDKILKKYEYKDSSLIPILQEAQKLMRKNIQDRITCF